MGRQSVGDAATDAADLDRPRRPAAGYAAAMERVGALLAADRASPVPLHPLSHSRFLTPAAGAPTRRVLVYFHGLTNGPQSFVPLAKRFVARGDAVLIPRLPGHGYADRLTTGLAGLTAGAVIDAAAEAVDLAAGLADEVLVAGISLGGVLAAWAAQYRPVRRAVVIAPSIGLPFLPGAVNRALIAVALALPNAFLWWDPRRKAALPGPPYAYPRYPTHALARVQRLGFAIVAAAWDAPPAATETWAVTNGADLAVSNGVVDELVRRWRCHLPRLPGPPDRREGHPEERPGGSSGWPSGNPSESPSGGRTATRVETFRFPGRLRLSHDIIDPLQPYQHAALTHPVLERIIGESTAPDPATLRRDRPQGDSDHGARGGHGGRR